MFRPPGLADGSAPPILETPTPSSTSSGAAPSPVETSQRLANESRPLPNAPRTLSNISNLSSIPPTPAPKDYPRDPIADAEAMSESSESVVLNEAPPMEVVETDSHALATAEHEEKGAAQLVGEEGRREVKDLGWTERHSTDNVPNPLVGGLKNEDLWILVRRFNKQMYHVKAIPQAPKGGLDLNIADEEEFSSDKLRSNIERIYMTVIVGMMAFLKHVARLRSWGEKRRTAGFAVVYAIAWFFDLLIPTFCLLILTLILYPPSRVYLFPPAPLALVNTATGTIQTPPSGQLASHTSLTGAPEKYAGEAVEQEASNFVSSFAAISLSSAMGKHRDQNKLQEESGAIDTSVPDPTDLATGAVEAKINAAGGNTGAAHDKTKRPMEEAMWEGVRPVMHVLGDIADTWERFGNALEPTPPFPKHKYRLKLAGVVAPLLLASFFITPYMVVKGLTFGIGFAFFGDPIIVRGVDILNRRIPNWPKFLELRNSILKGVPTNAQLTITLLRIGEVNKAPLPPPPRSDAPAPTQPDSIPNADELPMDVTQEEIYNTSVDTDTGSAHVTFADTSSLNTEEEAERKAKKKHGHKILGFLRGTTKAGVTTVLGADKVKATAGSEHSKNRLGILPKRAAIPGPAGPVIFEGRWKGKVGNLLISTSSEPATLSFALGKGVVGRVKGLVHSGGDRPHEHDERTETDSDDLVRVKEAEKRVDLETVWSIPIPSMKEVRKLGGLGWKGRLVVGWAMGSEVKDGLEIVDVKGEKVVVTAIQLREELFNRLISMGGQMWESW